MRYSENKEEGNFPDFIIVGTMKSGTTTVKDYLFQHPQVFIPSNELFYFNSEKATAKGISFYMKYFEGASPDQLVGEKTTTYSYTPGVAKKIYDVNPKAKIVWVFRDPVSRAYSNYWHAIKEGKEYLPFKEAVDNEEQRITKNPFWGYLERSIYVKQVEEYLQYFPREQMHYIMFEQMIRDQQTVLNKLSQFLGIEEMQLNKAIESNQTFLPKSQRLEYLARSVFGKSIFYKVVRKLNRKAITGYPKLDMSVRKELQQYFVPHNEKLNELTEIDFNSMYQ